MALVRVMLSNEVRLRLFPEVIDPDEVMLPEVMVMLSLANIVASEAIWLLVIRRFLVSMPK